MNPESGPRILAVTGAGCLGLFGFNSAGISVNLNLLRNTDSLAPSGGVPTHVILRKLLTSDKSARLFRSSAPPGEGRPRTIS